MSRKYRNPKQNQMIRSNQWFQHYFNYLQNLAYQLFEWHGLPNGVDPRYMEMMLHQLGYVGFYKDPIRGYIVTQGAMSGRVNHYLLPDEFTASSPVYHKTFKVYNYTDIELTEEERKRHGVVIYNNDMHLPTIPSLRIFASDLTELKEIIHVNQNAQKTPFFISTDDKTRLSMLNVFNQLEGNAPYIVVHKDLDIQNGIKVFQTQAPYVVDKLNEQRGHVWNEIMTWLGIKNANEPQKDRVTATQVNSNNEQIQASSNIHLKSREEACDRINTLHPDLDLSVTVRHDVEEEFRNQLMSLEMMYNQQPPEKNEDGEE